MAKPVLLQKSRFTACLASAAARLDRSEHWQWQRQKIICRFWMDRMAARLHNEHRFLSDERAAWRLLWPYKKRVFWYIVCQFTAYYFAFCLSVACSLLPVVPIYVQYTITYLFCYSWCLLFNEAWKSFRLKGFCLMLFDASMYHS